MSKGFDIEKFPTSEAAKRMLRRVSPIYGNAYVGKQIFQALGIEWDEAWEIITSLREQAFTRTVTWGIEMQEYKYSLIPDDTMTLEERRARLYRKKSKKFPLSPWRIEQYAKDGWGVICDVDETALGWGRIKLSVIEDETGQWWPMVLDVCRIKPSHLTLDVFLKAEIRNSDFYIAFMHSQADNTEVHPPIISGATAEKNVYLGHALTCCDTVAVYPATMTDTGLARGQPHIGVAMSVLDTAAIYPAQEED